MKKPTQDKPNTKDQNVQIKKLQEQVKSLEGKHQRAIADYQNLQRRTNNQKQLMLTITSAAIIEKFLTILDNLERATRHINDKGLGMVIDNFKTTLDEIGVKELEVLGENFDPSTMEASETAPGEKDIVIKIINKGYTLDDHLIRPAKVEVGNGQSKKS